MQYRPPRGDEVLARCRYSTSKAAYPCAFCECAETVALLNLPLLVASSLKPSEKLCNVNSVSAKKAPTKANIYHLTALIRLLEGFCFFAQTSNGTPQCLPEYLLFLLVFCFFLVFFTDLHSVSTPFHWKEYDFLFEHLFSYITARNKCKKPCIYSCIPVLT